MGNKLHLQHAYGAPVFRGTLIIFQGPVGRRISDAASLKIVTCGREGHGQTEFEVLPGLVEFGVRGALAPQVFQLPNRLS